MGEEQSSVNGSGIIGYPYTITDGTQSKLGAASEAFRPALSLISHPSPQALLPSDAQWPSSVLPQGLCTFCAAVSCALNPFLPFFA